MNKATKILPPPISDTKSDRPALQGRIVHGYDSDEGRALAGAITSIMTGHAYEQSARMAQAMGPFPGYHDARCSGIPKPLTKDNVKPMLEVMKLHREIGRASCRERVCSVV